MYGNTISFILQARNVCAVRSRVCQAPAKKKIVKKHEMLITFKCQYQLDSEPPTEIPIFCAFRGYQYQCFLKAKQPKSSDIFFSQAQVGLWLPQSNFLKSAQCWCRVSVWKLCKKETNTLLHAVCCQHKEGITHPFIHASGTYLYYSTALCSSAKLCFF